MKSCTNRWVFLALRAQMKEKQRGSVGHVVVLFKYKKLKNKTRVWNVRMFKCSPLAQISAIVNCLSHFKCNLIDEFKSNYANWFVSLCNACERLNLLCRPNIFLVRFRAICMRHLIEFGWNKLRMRAPVDVYSKQWACENPTMKSVRQTRVVATRMCPHSLHAGIIF